MKRMWIFLWGVLFGLFASVNAQKPDSIRFSLLTCAPGEAIYELFGHTAIRYQNFTRTTDIVFNYGMFSFDTPHFVYRFVKGENDYQLGINSMAGFKASYAHRGSSVYEQELNLTTEEKIKLKNLLLDNFRPENRVYRYNYFYNNCTTCARDQIERCVTGQIVYPHVESDKTFREIVHEFSIGSPWDQLGMDLCLGEEADRPIGIRLQMFAPFYLRKFVSEAYIEREDGTRRPLVVKEVAVVDVEPQQTEPGFPLSPMACAVLFLLVNIGIAFLQVRRNKIYKAWDLLLYGAQGLAGCIIAFLFFFSSHPTVGSNWMIILFNPLPLLFIPWTLFLRRKCKKDYFSYLNVFYLTFFTILSPLIPQEFNLTVLPLALGLLVNGISHLVVCRNVKENDSKNA